MDTDTTNGKKAFYITTTLPYTNSKPHVGFAMEIIRADAIARFKRLLGFDVFFNTGTDEHGIKIYQKAKEDGVDPQELVDTLSGEFQKLKEKLNLSYDAFIRTTDEDHKKAAQEFWKRCKDAGHIYKKTYRGTYCVGCEMFVTEKDLVNGECPHHPGKKLEEIEEENYFFAYSQFATQLKEYYEKNPNFVVPEFRLNEMKNLVENGLEDFSVSRLKERMPWGVPVPDDEEHVMYVWFDALINYISTLGWPHDEEKFNHYWAEGTPVQYCGKDNIQHQSARWQAMLLSVGLPLTDTVVVNGFITSGGQKMSKSIGNVIDPYDVVSEYGVDALRYYVLAELSAFEDSDFTMEKFKEAYNANLANGIGNLTNRILKMSETHLDAPISVIEPVFDKEYLTAFDQYNLQKASDHVWKLISDLDQTIQDREPFKLVKENPEEAKKIIAELVQGLYDVAVYLTPLLPDTAQKIKDAVKANAKPDGIFERKD